MLYEYIKFDIYCKETFYSANCIIIIALIIIIIIIFDRENESCAGNANIQIFA